MDVRKPSNSSVAADQVGGERPVGDASPPTPTLASVVAVWLIFAPTAACAAYALIGWVRINRTRLNAVYAILLALFFATLFGSFVFGMTRRYLRGRRSFRRP
ncbi:MAG: hypothetical protein ACE5E5_09955 [Phycisphaerae bacterium]